MDVFLWGLSWMDMLHSSGFPVVQSGVRLKWTMPLLNLAVSEETAIPIASAPCTLKALHTALQGNHRTRLCPDVPPDTIYVNDIIIPILFRTSMIIHSATPCFSSLFIVQSLMLVFGWLTISDIWELLQGRERSPFWKMLSLYCFHYDGLNGCVRQQVILYKKIRVFNLVLQTLMCISNMKSSALL